MREQHTSKRERDFFDVLRMLYRRKIIIVLPILLGAAIGWAVAAGQSPTYQASAVMVLDTRKIQVINLDSVVSRLPQDNAVLRSELDLISSRLLAERVVDRLNLMADPYLRVPRESLPLWVRPLRSVRSILSDWFPLGARTIDAILPKPAAMRDAPTRAEAIDHVLSGLRVSNDGRSYTIVVS